MADDARMPEPLYHGTSRIFLQSIQSGGLGARDPNVAFRSREMLDELADARNWDWYDDPDLGAIPAIISQRVTDAGFNFRHGNTYLSPSKTTAVKYALANRFGSELLSNTLLVFEKLKAFDQHIAREIIVKYPEILKLHTLAHKPLLVEASDIPIRNLRSENGEDPAHTLRMIRENAGAFQQIMWQQLNFELVAPHPPTSLKYYRIECDNADDNSILPGYSLKIMQSPSPTL